MAVVEKDVKVFMEELKEFLGYGSFSKQSVTALLCHFVAVAVVKTSERYFIHKPLCSALGLCIHHVNLSVWLERGHFIVSS